MVYTRRMVVYAGAPRLLDYGRNKGVLLSLQARKALTGDSGASCCSGSFPQACFITHQPFNGAKSQALLF